LIIFSDQAIRAFKKIEAQQKHIREKELQMPQVVVAEISEKLTQMVEANRTSDPKC